MVSGYELIEGELWRLLDELKDGTLIGEEANAQLQVVETLLALKEFEAKNERLLKKATTQGGIH